MSEGSIALCETEYGMRVHMMEGAFVCYAAGVASSLGEGAVEHSANASSCCSDIFLDESGEPRVAVPPWCLKGRFSSIPLFQRVEAEPTCSTHATHCTYHYFSSSSSSFVYLN